MIPSRTGRRLRLTTAEDQGVHVLTVSGEVDFPVRAEFRAGLVKAVDGANSPLVIDLSGVSYMEATGFSALIEAQKRMNERPDKLYIVVTSPNLRRLFSILALDAFFDVYDSTKNAMAAAAKGRESAAVVSGPTVAA